MFVGCLLAMRRGGKGEAAEVEEGAAPATTSKGLGPAVRFILGAPPIVAITLFYMSVNIAGGIVTVVTPLYVRDVLLGGPETFGLLLSVLTAGDLVGLLVVGAVNWRWPLGRSIAWALLTSGLVILLWLLRPQVAALGAILLAWGALSSSLTPWAQTIRMRLIPPEMRGRVFALLRTAMQSTRPIGAIAGGILVARGDLTIAILAVGLLFRSPASSACGCRPSAEARPPIPIRHPSCNAARPSRTRSGYAPGMANVIDYVELAVDDLERAKAFYAAALGWTFADYGPDYAGIQDPTRRGQEFGGLNPHPATSRGDGVLALVRTDDADAALASVLAAGGSIHIELHEYPGGRRFMFTDPFGNILGVYEPAE